MSINALHPEAIDRRFGTSGPVLGGLPATELAMIVRLASRVEMSRARCLRWLAEDPIDALGGLTGTQLIAMGKVTQIIGFLHHVAWSARQLDRDDAEDARAGRPVVAEMDSIERPQIARERRSTAVLG